MHMSLLNGNGLAHSICPSSTRLCLFAMLCTDVRRDIELPADMLGQCVCCHHSVHGAMHISLVDAQQEQQAIYNSIKLQQQLGKHNGQLAVPLLRYTSPHTSCRCHVLLCINLLAANDCVDVSGRYSI